MQRRLAAPREHDHRRLGFPRFIFKVSHEFCVVFVHVEPKPDSSVSRYLPMAIHMNPISPNVAVVFLVAMIQRRAPAAIARAAACIIYGLIGPRKRPIPFAPL
eukprot:149586-Pyramimonas_sp.AAC.1